MQRTEGLWGQAAMTGFVSAASLPLNGPEERDVFDSATWGDLADRQRQPNATPRPMPRPPSRRERYPLPGTRAAMVAQQIADASTASRFSKREMNRAGPARGREGNADAMDSWGGGRQESEDERAKGALEKPETEASQTSAIPALATGIRYACVPDEQAAIQEMLAMTNEDDFMVVDETALLSSPIQMPPNAQNADPTHPMHLQTNTSYTLPPLHLQQPHPPTPLNPRPNLQPPFTFTYHHPRTTPGTQYHALPAPPQIAPPIANARRQATPEPLAQPIPRPPWTSYPTGPERSTPIAAPDTRGHKPPSRPPTVNMASRPPSRITNQRESMERHTTEQQRIRRVQPAVSNLLNAITQAQTTERETRHAEAANDAGRANAGQPNPPLDRPLPLHRPLPIGQAGTHAQPSLEFTRAPEGGWRPIQGADPFWRTDNLDPELANRWATDLHPFLLVQVMGSGAD